MKEIILSGGEIALVDDEDYEVISKHRWMPSKQSHTTYAVRSRYKKPTVRMHRFIMKAEANQYVDHINGNGLDNRKANLRICTNHENQRNRGKSKNKTSIYKGVSWDKRRNKWLAQIQVNKKSILLGRFTSEKEAADAYDEAALKYFKEFAKTNKHIFKEAS